MPVRLIHHGGLFLALLVVAMTKLQVPRELGFECDSIAQGSSQGCDADDDLVAPRAELQGLELLQMEVALRPAPASPTPRAKAVGVAHESKPLVSTESHSFAHSLSLLGSSMFQRNAESSFIVQGFMAGLRMQSGGTLFVVVFMLSAVCLLSFLVVPLLSGSQRQEKREAAAGAPAAQQMLQAPQSTNPMQSPIRAYQRSPSSTATLPARDGVPHSDVPPICPTLVLPHTEARFMVPLDSLLYGSEKFDIKGTSGRKLLHGSVSSTPEGRRCLAIASVGCEEDPRVTVVTSVDEHRSPRGRSSFGRGSTSEAGMATASRSMEVYGMGGKFYGHLEPANGGGALLRYEGEVVMSLETGPDFHLTASSMDGRMVATAGKNAQVSSVSTDGGDTWKLQVKPGYDAILITASMLGVILFSQ